MTEANTNHEPSSIKELISSNLYICSLYCITAGLLYLWGYWPEFNINILEYLDVTDILKVTAYPIAISFFVLSIGSGFANFMPDSSINSPTAPGSQIRTDRAKQERTRTLLKIIYSLLFIAALLADTIIKWSLLPHLIALPLLATYGASEVITKRIPDARVRRVIVYVVTVLPLLAYGTGQIAAENIKSGRTYTYLTAKHGNFEPQADHLKSLRYVGHAGDFMFFYDPVKDTTVVTKFDDDATLVLKRHNPYKTFSELTDEAFDFFGGIWLKSGEKVSAISTPEGLVGSQGARPKPSD